MSTFFGRILAAALMSRFQGGTFEGTVVDDHVYVTNYWDRPGN